MLIFSFFWIYGAIYREGNSMQHTENCSFNFSRSQAFWSHKRMTTFYWGPVNVYKCPSSHILLERLTYPLKTLLNAVSLTSCGFFGQFSHIVYLKANRYVSDLSFVLLAVLFFDLWPVHIFGNLLGSWVKILNLEIESSIILAHARAETT